jgi:hypothetical protein
MFLFNQQHIKNVLRPHSTAIISSDIQWKPTVYFFIDKNRFLKRIESVRFVTNGATWRTAAESSGSATRALQALSSISTRLREMAPRAVWSPLLNVYKFEFKITGHLNLSRLRK